LDGIKPHLLGGAASHFGFVLSLNNTQIAAGHIFWLGLAERAKHGWRDVSQGAAGLKLQVIIIRD